MSTSTNYKNNITVVRELLQKRPDGLTMREVIQATGLTYSCAYKAVERIRGSHVDRWVPDERIYKWAPVFRVENPRPADAPKPEIMVKAYLDARQKVRMEALTAKTWEEKTC